MEKDKLVMFIVMLVTICISVFSLSRSYEAENIATTTEKKVDSATLSLEIFADKNSGAAPHAVTFSPLVLNARDSVNYSWDFGDGETSEEVMPTHTYAETGSYVCTLTVTDAQKNKITKQIEISVIQNNPPLVKIIVDKVTGNRPTKINFDASCFDVDGEIVSYDWEITDPAIFGKRTIHTYTEKNFSRTFIRPGFYEIKLTIADDAGNLATDYMKLQILKSMPEQFVDSITGLINRGLYFYGQIQNLKDLLGKIINPNHAPDMPSNPSPTDAATGVDVNADLSWICTDPDNDVLTYDIYFGTTSPPPLVISGYNDTNFVLGALLPGTAYYWKIVAKDPDGVTTTGPIWSFTTG